MNILPKSGPGPSRYFTPDQIRVIAESLTIGIDVMGIRPVHFGVTQPADTSVPWQRTDSMGNPIGKISFFSEGGWK